MHRVKALPEQDKLDRETDAFLSEMAATKAFSGKIKKLSNDKKLNRDPLLISDEEVSTQFDHLSSPIRYEKRIVSNRKIVRYISWQAAAMVAILLVAGTVYYLMQTSHIGSPHKDLFAAYYDTYQIDPVMRSDWITDQEQLLQAFFAYEWGQYETAARRFQEAYHVTEKEGRESLMFFAGVSYLEAGETDAAIEALYVVTENPWSIFYPEAKWYLGLGYLDKGAKEEAKKIFERLQAMGRPYPDKVDDILLELGQQASMSTPGCLVFPKARL